MADDATTIELSRSNSSAPVAGYAVACRRVLAIFERERPGDRRPRPRSTRSRRSWMGRADQGATGQRLGGTGRLRRPAMQDELRERRCAR